MNLFRFNTEDYPAKVGLALDPHEPSEIRLLVGQDDVVLGRARGIWVRRPRWPEIDPIVDDPVDRAFARQEAVAAMGGAWRILADRCVSPPDVLQATRWKVAQLSIARKVGFAVPETLVTTDPVRARDFVAAGPTVMKAVAEARVQTTDQERVGSTVAVDERSDFDAVRPAPVLFQRRVAKVADVRVTVVGRRIFAVRIVTPPGSPLDFRLSEPAACRYEVIDLSEAIRTAVNAYLDDWGLRFGAFDLAEDHDGRLWFLECNPAGQWAWLEPPTGLDITSTLLDLLLDPVGLAQ